MNFFKEFFPRAFNKMPIQLRLVGRVTPCAPFGLQGNVGAPGVTRPTTEGILLDAPSGDMVANRQVCPTK